MDDESKVQQTLRKAATQVNSVHTAIGIMSANSLMPSALEPVALNFEFTLAMPTAVNVRAKFLLGPQQKCKQ